MYEYQVRLNGVTVNYVIYPHRVSTQAVKNELVGDGWSDKITVKLYRRF